MEVNNVQSEQIKQKFPLTMVAILALIGYSVYSSLRALFGTPVTGLGPWIFGGVVAIVTNLISVGILAAIFYGIIRRLKWARKLAIGWYILSLSLLLITLISFLIDRDTYIAGYLAVYQSALPPEQAATFKSTFTPELITGSVTFVILSGGIFGLVILSYLWRKKDFFVN